MDMGLDPRKRDFLACFKQRCRPHRPVWTFVQSDQHLCYKFVWFDSLGSSQQFLFMSEQVFMGRTSPKQLIKYLAQGHNRVTLPAVRLIPVALQPHSKHLPTEPLHGSYWLFGKYCSSTSSMQNFNILASLCSIGGWFEPYIVANLKDKFSLWQYPHQISMYGPHCDKTCLQLQRLAGKLKIRL